MIFATPAAAAAMPPNPRALLSVRSQETLRAVRPASLRLRRQIGREIRRCAVPASEVAPSHLFLACEDSSYMTGQVLHPNGG